jgi:hypothetical protein
LKDIIIEIPKDLQDKLDALPDKKNPVWKEWTPAMDKALLNYWPIKNHEQVAKTLNVSPLTALRRYRKLMEALDEPG